MRRPVAEVYEAWTRKGVNPNYHARMKAQLRVQWPTLANALDELEREMKRVDL